MAIVDSKKMVIYDDLAENKVDCDKGIDKMVVLGQNMDFDQESPCTLSHRSGDVIYLKSTGKSLLKQKSLTSLIVF